MRELENRNFIKPTQEGKANVAVKLGQEVWEISEEREEQLKV